MAGAAVLDELASGRESQGWSDAICSAGEALRGHVIQPAVEENA